MNSNDKKIANYADILAIPGFLLLIIYFYNIHNKSIIEYVLLSFSILGFILDIYFTYLFIINKSEV